MERSRFLVCAPRRHWIADGPLPRETPATVLDMHIVLVKLNNRAGIEVKIQVRTYLISTPAGTRPVVRSALAMLTFLWRLSNTIVRTLNSTQCPCSCYDTIMFF